MKKIGVIGLGVGESHVEFAEKSWPGAVTAVCDLLPAKVEGVRKKYPHIKAARDFASLIADPTVGTVVIASFDQCHEEQVLAAIRAGKDIFVEKPLCLTSKGCREIRNALQKNPVRLASNLIMRYYPRFEAIHSQLDQLGKLFYLEGSYNYGRIEKITSGWRSETKDYSVMLGGGVHIVDLILWLKQGVRVKEVSAFSSKCATLGTNFSPPDLTAALLKFEDGALAKVTANFGCVRPHFHEFQWYGEKASGAHCEEGWLIHRSRDPQVKPEFLKSEYPGVGKGRMLVDFLGNKTGAVAGAEDTLACMSVCLAIDEAAKSNRVIPVEYF